MKLRVLKSIQEGVDPKVQKLGSFSNQSVFVHLSVSADILC